MMKKFVFRTIALLILMSGVLVSCEDTKPEEGMPSVTLTAGKTTSSTLKFTAALRNSYDCKYMVLKRSDSAPTAAGILSDGLPIDKTWTTTVEGLRYSTSYRVYAVAYRGDLVSEVAYVDATTKDPDENPAVELVPGEATQTTLAFGVTLTDIERAAYVCLEKTDAMELPGAEEILRDGITISQSGDEVAEGLEPGVTYVIVAAGQFKDLISETVSIEMTTLDPTPVPIISLVAGTPAQNELVFYVASSDAERTAYVCLEKSGATAIPTAERILETGTAITDTKVTVGGLKAGTAYVIAVAALNKDVYSEVKTLEMTTEPEQAGPIVFTTQAAGGYYGDSHNSGYAEYHFVVADGATAEADGVYTTVGAGRAMSFDLYQFKSYSTPIKIPARTYNYNTNYGMNTFAPEKTYCMVNDGNGNITKVEFKAGKVDVKLVGTTYTITAELTTADGEEFSAVYTGALTIEDKQSQDKDLPALEKNVTGMTFIRALAKYYSYVDVSDNCVVNLYDVEPTVNGSSDYLSLPGHMVTLNLATAVSQDMVLQEGTYTVSDTDEPGTFAAGYQTEFMDMVMAMGTYCEERSENLVSFYGLITGGTVVITKAGAGYRFELDFTTSKGYRIGGTYEGAVEMTDMRSKSASAPAAQNARALKLRRP